MSAERYSDLAETLHLVGKDLRLRLIPQLQSETARSQGAMIVSLLGMIERELADGQASDAFDAAVTAAAAIVAPGAPPTIASVERAAGAAGAGQGGIAAWRAIAAIAQADELRLTGRTHTGHDSYAESGAGAKQALEVQEPSFDASALQAYLRAREPRYAQITVNALRLLPGGFSKSTYLADLVLDGSAVQWILRRDLEFSPLSSFVPDEFPLLRFIHASGFPVPEPLWCEADPARLGAATMAVSKIGGEGDMTIWSADAGRAQAIGCQAARLTASLHALDPASLPPLQTSAPGAKADTPAQQLDHLRDFWRTRRVEANPMVELLFGWLAAHLPKAAGRGLVHGDFGLHNLIVQGDRIAALLDWEFAHIGDPQEDLAYGRPFIARIMDWDVFVDAYVAAGGSRPDPASLDYYTVFGTFRNALGCLNVLHAVRHKLRTIDSKFAYVGRAYANALLLDAARAAGVI